MVTAASGRLFRKGLLIKHGTALERLAEVDTVVFDKTGTLTMGAPEPTNLDDHPAHGGWKWRWRLPGPPATRWRARWPKRRAPRGLRPARVEDLREVPGYGVEGVWKGARVRLGRAEWCGAEQARTETATYLCTGDGAPARLYLCRPSAPRRRRGGGRAAGGRASG